MKNATTPTYEDRAAKSLHAPESQDNVVSPPECGSQTKRCNGGRPKKWVKPTAERLRQDFISAARGRTALNATKIVERMKIECPAYSIAPQCSGGHRKASNFIQTGLLAADVDCDMTLEEAQQNLFVLRNASLIHTTASHTEQRHRFRIIFLLDEPITNAADYAASLLGLADMVGSDRSVADGARMFFGNRNAVFINISKTLSPGIVANLIAKGRDIKAQKQSPNKGVWPVDSSRKMGPGALVKLAGGELCRFDELKIGASVHCPYHADVNPSAFVVQSLRRNAGIHCCACKVTFWPDNQRDFYDFDAFPRLFEERRMTETAPPEAEMTGFDRFFPPQPRYVKLQEIFLPPLDYRPGLTFVRSRKGSGKTQALVSLLDWIRAGGKNDKPTSVLLIGHRRTLLREAAAKLKMPCYLDADFPNERLVTFAVSLDSLPKYGESFPADGGKPGWKRPKGSFDLVIIDEVEQVLKHLLSETIDKRAGLERCFHALLREVTNAKAPIEPSRPL
jgi:hypothetical protein